MSEIKHINTIEEFQSYCDKAFKGANTKEMLFSLGAGFDISTYKSAPSWSELNKSALSFTENGWVDLLDEPRIKSLGPQLLSTYASYKVKSFVSRGGEMTEKEILLNPLSKTKMVSNLGVSLDVIGRSYANIITTNYRVPEEFKYDRKIIDFTRPLYNSLKSKLIFAHGSRDIGNIVYSEDEFISHYRENRYKSMVNLLSKQGIKYVFLFGFSGRDTKFLRLISTAFMNSDTELIFFTGDFNRNIREADLFRNIMATNYNFSLMTYNYENMPVPKMMEAILNSVKENNRRVITDDEWYFVINSGKKSKKNKLDYIYNKININNSSFSYTALAEKMDSINLSINEIKESKVDLFIKSTIVEHRIISGGKDQDELVGFFLEFDNHNYIDENLSKALIKYAGQCKDETVSGKIYFTVFKDSYSKNITLSAEQYTKIKKYQMSLKTDVWERPYVHRWPKIVANTYKEVEQITLAFAEEAISPLTDILNISIKSELSEVIGSISSFFKSKNEKDIKNFLRKMSTKRFETKYSGRKAVQWVILMHAFLDISGIVIVGDVWEGTSKNLSSYLHYFKDKEHKMDLSGLKDFKDLYMKPEENYLFGMISSNKKWSTEMLKHVENNKTWIDNYPRLKKQYIKAIKNTDFLESEKIEKEVRRGWTSRSLGDGTLDYEEKNYDSLIKERSFDFLHVYKSWVANKSINIDKKIIALFIELENLDLDNWTTLKNKYSDNLTLSVFIKDQTRELFSKSSLEGKITTGDIKKYIIEFLNYDDLAKSFNKSIKDNDYNLFTLDTSGVFEYIKDGLFKKNEKNIQDYLFNSKIFEECLRLIDIKETFKSILRLRYSYYLYGSSKKPVEIIKGLKSNKLYAWGVLTSSITYWSEKDNVRLSEVFKEINWHIVKKNDHVSEHNQMFAVVQIHYVSGQLSKIVEDPIFMDIILEFVYKNKNNKRFKEYSKMLLENGNFKNVTLRRMREKDLWTIPVNIFKKIMLESESIGISPIIEYTDKRKTLQDITEVSKRIMNDKIKIREYDIRQFENSKNSYYYAAKFSKGSKKY